MPKIVRTLTDTQPGYKISMGRWNFPFLNKLKKRFEPTPDEPTPDEPTPDEPTPPPTPPPDEEPPDEEPPIHYTWDMVAELINSPPPDGWKSDTFIHDVDTQPYKATIKNNMDVIVTITDSDGKIVNKNVSFEPDSEICFTALHRKYYTPSDDKTYVCSSEFKIISVK